MDAETPIETIMLRCPEWRTCSRKNCAHNGIHNPNLDYFTKTPGSIRPIACPDCKAEEK
jgi:hypothetical protein